MSNLPGLAQQTFPSDKAGVTTTTGKMLGLNQSFTPLSTGALLIIVTGNVSGGSAPGLSIRYGTGAAPAHGAAPVGLVCGTQQSPNNGNWYGFPPIIGVVSGLIVGTTYWIDIDALMTGGGSVTYTGVSISIVELGSGTATSVTAPNYASAPSSPNPGDQYFDTTDSHFYGWNGATWVQLDN